MPPTHSHYTEPHPYLVAQLAPGTSVLDLGCGSGRDVFLLAQLVGPTGRVVGVDMTEAQLEVPLRLEQWHRQRFGYAVKNTQFVKGTMEALGVCLADAGVAVPEINDDAGGVDGAFDVLVSACMRVLVRECLYECLYESACMNAQPPSRLTTPHTPHPLHTLPPTNSTANHKVSNCVVNLVPDKRAVMMEAFAALKEGGELYFSDVYASARVPIDLQQDSELWGECLSGALYWNDFVRLAKEVGFADPRLVSDTPIGVKNTVLEKKIAGRVMFYSATYRLFKLRYLIITTKFLDFSFFLAYVQVPRLWALEVGAGGAGHEMLRDLSAMQKTKHIL